MKLRLALLAGALFIPRAGADSPAQIGQGDVRVTAGGPAAGAALEDFGIRAGGGWETAARGLGTQVILASGRQVHLGRKATAVENGAVVERLSGDGFEVSRRLAFAGIGNWIRVSTRLQCPPGTLLHSFVDRFSGGSPRGQDYSPAVGGFVPDADYKAPVILAQSDGRAVAIVPDLSSLGAGTLAICNHALVLDARGGASLAVGFVPARLAYHSVYSEDDARSWKCPASLENDYFILVAPAARPADALGEAERFLWERFGRPTQAAAAIQQQGTATPDSSYWWVRTKGPADREAAMDRSLARLTTWDSWRDEVWRVQSEGKWMGFTLGGAQVGGVPTLRWGPGPALYFTAWFNTLRTSYGMALYARREGKPGILSLATQTFEAALRAPGRLGAFKCVAVPTKSGVLWAAGDGNGAGTEAGYLGYDMSWTAYWLLRWKESGLPGGERAMPRCEALANFLCERQQPDGMLPTRFGEDGAVDAPISRTVKAETGPAALFLLELYSQDRKQRWLDAAVRALAFLDREVIPLRQWYDFETFWSCSPRAPALDSRTNQWPANDLALGQAVEAYAVAYRVTGKREFLERGEALLDYLLLFQQVWTNPRLEGVQGPSTLLGGFTTQNSDAEWSDARQSQMGSVILDYYRATGKAEYLERGIAAVRSQFPVSPCENWAHTGYGSKSGISSFHWGTGSGMAGVEMEDEFLRDAAVDLAAGAGVGFNGIDVGRCSVDADCVRLEYSTPFAWKGPAVFTFHASKPEQTYTVWANGTEAGKWTGKELAAGVPLPAPVFAARIGPISQAFSR